METPGSADRTIDLNADVGESFGPWPMGADEELVPLVSSVNIACGGHAGDPVTILATCALAVRHGAVIGAHPGYPDLVGFGRRDIALTAAELRATLVVQVGAVQAAARLAGSVVRHVKPHGALYNLAARDPDVARTVAGAMRDLDPGLILVGLAGSASLDAGQAAGLAVAAEAFADRRYEADGSLRSRSLPGALLGPADAAAQAVSIARDGVAIAQDGSPVVVRADTVCVHGDSPGAVAVARAVRTALETAGIRIAPIGPIAGDG
ncbi:MAG TPA: 5-oxoprolinase subunit PxpA [Candidatus Limnocylindrales bacterium]|nr:5-oxoprolinase subunit PxpA [Candidatus Limnocylindrales bacterium]